MSFPLRGCLLALLVTSRALAEPTEVVVQAGPVARRGLVRDDSVAGSVIQGEALRTPGAEASDLLRRLPGTTVVDTGGIGALSTASLRGATSAQTPVYLAGIRINDDVNGTADLSTIPLGIIDRIEVYRGHAPPQADRLAIGGALFFDPRRLRGAQASLVLGSFGFRGVRASASTGASGSPWGVTGSIGTQRANNDYAYRDDRGTSFLSSDDRLLRRRNADGRSDDFWGMGYYRPTKQTRIFTLIHGVSREQGVPGLGLFPTHAARASLTRILGAVRGEHRCEGDRCEVDLTTSVLQSEADFEDPLREIALGGASLQSRGGRVEQSAFWRAEVHEQVELHGALDVAVERLAISLDHGREEHATRRFSRAALGSIWNIHPSVELRGLGAVECNGVTGTSLCDLPVGAGRLGALWRIEELELLLNAGRYNRAPTLGEQRGLSATVRGNSSLQAERGVVIDGGLRHSGRVEGMPVAVELFGFSQWISDLIVYKRSSLGYLRPYNVGQTRTMGVEATLRASPWRWLLAEVSLTGLDPRDVSPDRVGANDLLPFRSRLQAAPSLQLKISGYRMLDEAILKLHYIYQSSRYAEASGQVVLPAQGSLDLGLSLFFWQRRIGLRGRAANLLDQVRTDVVGYPLPGRSFFLSMEILYP